MRKTERRVGAPNSAKVDHRRSFSISVASITMGAEDHKDGIAYEQSDRSKIK